MGHIKNLKYISDEGDIYHPFEADIVGFSPCCKTTDALTYVFQCKYCETIWCNKCINNLISNNCPNCEERCQEKPIQYVDSKNQAVTKLSEEDSLKYGRSSPNKILRTTEQLNTQLEKGNLAYNRIEVPFNSVFDKLIEHDSIDFKNAVFEEEIRLSDVSLKCNLEFKTSFFSKDVTFIRCNLENLDFVDAKIKGKLHFYKCKIKSIDLSGAHLENMFSVYNSEIEGNALFLGTQFKSTFEHNLMENVTFHKECKFDALNTSTLPSISDFIVKDCNFIDVFYFQKFNRLGKIEFFNVIFQSKCYFDWIRSVQQFVFNEVIFNDSTTFENTNAIESVFSSCQFYKNFNYSNFNNEHNKGRLVFEHCDVNGIANFSQSNFSYIELKSNGFKGHADFSKLKIGRATRESYRTIKNELLNDNNHIEATKVKAQELNELYIEMRGTSIFKRNYPEFLILAFNKLSNNFGTNWVKGVLFSVGASVIGFVLYLASLESLWVEWEWDSFKSFICLLSEGLKYFVQFLYVPHSVSFMDDFNPSGMSYAIDFIFRIIISYGYVQTVQAFRKYGIMK